MVDARAALEDLLGPAAHAVRCVAFDAVGTLLAPCPSVTEVYCAVARHYGSRLDAEEIGRRFHAAFRDTERGLPATGEPAQLDTSEELEYARWREIVERVITDVADVEPCFRDLFQHFARPESWRCDPDAGPTLAALSAAGCQVVLASNFDARLHTVAAGFPELRLISQTIVSAAVGHRKPSVRFYEALLQTTRCAPHEVLMIGDDFENDVAAARSAGLHALLLDRRNGIASGCISRLRDLCEV